MFKMAIALVSSITAKLLKTGGANLTPWLVHIINEVWMREELPDDWRHGVILALWKHKGDRLICSTH